MATDLMMARLSEPFPDAVVKTKPGRGGSRPLSYISHALITERLNDVDPDWSWRVVTEHVYFDTSGLPHCAGVTVEMTVGGVSRVEAGGPQRQDGFANEIKNSYSDAIKRAAMRFGVALRMWDALVDSQDDEDNPPQPAQRIEPQQRAAIESQHERNVSPQTQPPPMRLNAPRAKLEPDGQERVRLSVERKCEEKGVPVLDGDSYATIAETVNKALMDAGKGLEVRTDAHGQVTPGDILNALMALPTPVRA